MGCSSTLKLVLFLLPLAYFFLRSFFFSPRFGYIWLYNPLPFSYVFFLSYFPFLIFSFKQVSSVSVKPLIISAVSYNTCHSLVCADGWVLAGLSYVHHVLQWLEWDVAKVNQFVMRKNLLSASGHEQVLRLIICFTPLQSECVPNDPQDPFLKNTVFTNILSMLTFWKAFKFLILDNRGEIKNDLGQL